MNDRMFYEDNWNTTEGSLAEEDELRNYFLEQMTLHNAELAHHHIYGTTLRAMHQVLGEILPAPVTIFWRNITTITGVPAIGENSLSTCIAGLQIMNKCGEGESGLTVNKFKNY